MIGILSILKTVFIMMGFVTCFCMIHETDKKINELYYYIKNKELKEIKK